MDRNDRSAFADKPGSSPANRSLERGIELLRAFRAGSDLLGNGELAERTGLSRATVTRLTQTLVGSGLLLQEPTRKGYRLAPAVLSLAHAARAGSRTLQVAAPLMRELASQRQINVGLAAPDRDEMVYLESIRYSRRAAFRTVVSGQRVPMELTSLGRAYLAVAADARRVALFERFAQRRGDHWPMLQREIRKAIANIRRVDFCAASWQAEVVALATPLAGDDGVAYSLNVSLSTLDGISAVSEALAQPLLDLKARILAALERQAP